MCWKRTGSKKSCLRVKHREKVLQVYHFRITDIFKQNHTQASVLRFGLDLFVLFQNEIMESPFIYYFDEAIRSFVGEGNAKEISNFNH